MISLRKHIDDFNRPQPEVSTADKVENTPRVPPRKADSDRGTGRNAKADIPRPDKSSGDPAVAAFSTVLRAVSAANQRAVPCLAEDLQRSLREIEQSLPEAAALGLLPAASGRVETELSGWADRASQHYAENEKEIKEIIAVVARASESLAERDQRFAAQMGELNGKLRGFAELEDLGAIRRSILDTTRALRDCIEKMAEEGRESQRRMGTEVAEYKKRLAESERLSKTDSLTKLANRRAFEQELDVRIVTGQKFCLILMDLNDFKTVNDTWGHAAGDDLLRQFAEELRAQFSAADLVARWGGDEFAILIGGNRWAAETRVEGVRRWVLGDYKLANGAVRANVDAAIGIAEWDGREPAAELVARADKGVYAGKRDDRRQGDRRTPR